MKNKEIELILTKLKIVSEEKENGCYICDREHSKLLLSYIEQLKKRNKELYEGFMATQEELTDYATKNEQLEKENEKLKQWDKNKDTRNSRQRVSNAYQIIQNDKLKRCFNTQKRRRKEEAQKKKLYKSRIDKAIEFIEEKRKVFEWYDSDLFYLESLLKGDSDE